MKYGMLSMVNAIILKINNNKNTYYSVSKEILAKESILIVKESYVP
jgi:hypothetical protein